MTSLNYRLKNIFRKRKNWQYEADCLKSENIKLDHKLNESIEWQAALLETDRNLIDQKAELIKENRKLKSQVKELKIQLKYFRRSDE